MYYSILYTTYFSVSILYTINVVYKIEVKKSIVYKIFKLFFVVYKIFAVIFIHLRPARIKHRREDCVVFIKSLRLFELREDIIGRRKGKIEG